MCSMVPGCRAPSLATSRVRATARTARQIATLSDSTPSDGETLGRNGEPTRELDTGTTTTSSSSTPARISSTETTTAGRCLPGSPVLAAPSATSHSSPRRGSSTIEAIVERVDPIAVLIPHRWHCRLHAGGFSLCSKHRLAFGAGGEFCEQGGHRNTPRPGLSGQSVTGRYRHPDRRRRCRHSL